MKAAIYSRKSKFTGKGESIENQVQLCREYCVKHGIEIFDVYEDEGFTGANINRPEYQRMLKDAKKKRFDMLICYRLDRISRNIVDFSTLVTDLQEHDISFISIREQFDTSTPMGRAMMYILAIFAQLERETTQERIKDNMYQLARTGRWLGGKTPIGFKSEAISFYDDNMKVRKLYKLVPISEEINTVKQLFKKYIELGGVYKLQGYCYKNGLKSKQGNNFDIRSLENILANPVYCIADELAYEYCLSKNMDIAREKDEFNGVHGLMVYNKTLHKKNSVKKKDFSEWIVAIGKHKGIVKTEDWIKVQDMLDTPTVSYREGTSQVGILSSLLVCGECGSKMMISYKTYNNGKVKHHYYKCRLKDKSRGTLCKSQNLNGKDADKEVIEKLKEIALNKDTILHEYLNKQTELKSNINSSGNEKVLLMKQQEDLEKRIQNLTMQLSQNSKSAAAKYIIKQIEDLDNQIKDVKTKLINIEDNAEISLLRKMNAEILSKNLEYFYNNFDNLEILEKRNLIRNIIKYIRSDGTKLQIKLLDI